MQQQKQTIATCDNKYDLSKHNIERKKTQKSPYCVIL